MEKTQMLGLPIYAPEDIFDLTEVNKAHKNIEMAYQAIEGIQNVNANAEVIGARKGEPNLKTKIDKIDDAIEANANEIALVNDFANVLEEDIEDINSQLDTKANLKNMKINIKEQGLKCDGTNEIEKLRQIINLNVYNDNPTFYFPSGDYCIEETLLITRRCNIEMDRGARIYTNTELDYLIEYMTDKTSSSEVFRSIKNSWYGGVLDGQDKVKCLAAFGCYTNFVMQDVCFYNFKEKGLMTRKVSTDNVSTGGFMGQFLYFRNWKTYLGSIAIYNNGNDNKFFDITIVNVEQGIWTKDGIFNKIHMWLDRVALFPTSKFAHIETSYASFDNCIIDTIRTGFTSAFNKQVRVTNTNFIASNYVYTEELAQQYGFTFFSGEGYYYALNCLSYIDYGTHTVCDSPRSNHNFLNCRFASNGTINNGTYRAITTDNDLRQGTLNNPDLNKYNTVNATHKIGSATSGLNFPTTSKETGVLKIEVFGQDDSSRIAIQTFYPNSTIYKFYVRRYTASNDTWSLWGKVSLVQDV